MRRGLSDQLGVWEWHGFTSPRLRGESLPSGFDPRVDARRVSAKSAAGEGLNIILRC